MPKSARAAIVLLFAVGCGSDGESASTAGPDPTSTSATTGETTDATTGADTTATTADPSTTGDDGSTSGGGGSTGGVFISDPDGGVSGMCDVWGQDCPEGEKCTAALVNGMVGNVCVPVDRNPGVAGDPCTRDDTSGEDSCALGLLCVPDADPDLQRCFPFCQGSPAAPTCPDSTDECVLADGGATPICFPTCDPLLQDCGIVGWACYPGDGDYICAPDQSGGAGTQGEPCGSLNSCTEGLLCSGAVANCDAFCCSPYCDLGAADPDAACPGAADGETCQAIYDPAPPGFEDVGICAVPA